MVRTIRVYANPCRALDADGNPACAIQMHDARSLYIGAARTEERGVEFQGHKGGKYHDDRIAFTFDGAAVELRGEDAISYVRQFAKSQELIPADEATATIMGVEFADPKKILADWAKRSAAEHEQRTGMLPEWAQKQPIVKAEKAGS